MMWARGISEFGAVIILAYHPMIAPVLVFERFEAFGLDHARPIAAILDNRQCTRLCRITSADQSGATDMIDIRNLSVELGAFALHDVSLNIKG
jgi:hypothetical protein